MNTNRENATRLLRIIAPVLILVAFSSLGTQAASTFGFDYWPAGYSCNVLTNANWTTANQNVVQADIDQMSSLGADVLRLIVWPEVSGYLLQPGGGPGGGTFTSDFTQEQNNLVTLLSYCSSRGVKVIICFANDYLTLGNGSPGDRWWMDFDGNTTDGFTNFLRDTQYWVDGFVNTIQGSAYASAILYYDYQSEYTTLNPNEGWYVTFLYDWSTIPSGKRACSVLRVLCDRLGCSN